MHPGLDCFELHFFDVHLRVEVAREGHPLEGFARLVAKARILVDGRAAEEACAHPWRVGMLSWRLVTKANDGGLTGDVARLMRE